MSLNDIPRLYLPPLNATPEELEKARAYIPAPLHPNSKANLHPPFAPGNKRGGRGVGSRNKLSEAFLKSMHEDFLKHGQTVIAHARREDPVSYLKIIASLLPKDFKLDASDDMKKFMELVSRGGQVVTGPDGNKYIELDAEDIEEIRPEDPAATGDLLS